MTFIDRTGNLSDIKSRISSFIRLRGPSLPIHIAKEAKTSLLLASAFLSDMLSEKTIKMSNLKVGSSSLYYLPGQEAMLENFQNHLPGKEREAFQMLKSNKVLRDDELEPAFRVAIRSLKDFALPFLVKIQDQQITFWQYYAVPEEEAREIIGKNLEKTMPQAQPIQTTERKVETIIEVKVPETEKVVAKEDKPSKEEFKFEIKQPKIEKILEEKSQERKTEKKVKEKPKDASFLDEIKPILLKKDIELLEEIKFDKKEVIAKVRINSDLGKIFLVLLAQDKKKIGETEILKAYQQALDYKMPCLFMSKSDISKKTEELIEPYKNMLKFLKI